MERHLPVLARQLTPSALEGVPMASADSKLLSPGSPCWHCYQNWQCRHISVDLV
ncbi:MAG: hypothetical protein KME46_21055 [Brasilonema angustatum HA4187-MV1]|nr:hypothetical protein [Brasilonema angustatum HA4187-MV1]